VASTGQARGGFQRAAPRVALALLAAATSGVIAKAAGPTFWTVSTAADLLRGTSSGMLVGLDGIVTLGPQLTPRLTSTPAQVWSLSAGADGTIWAGTGGDGRLLRLRPGQPEEVAATTTESAIFAVAVSGSRTYYATSPDGRVYVIDGTAAARPFFDPKEKYIWALAVDRQGQLWVGAGTPAVIYRVDPSGTGRPLYHPPAAHVVCLTTDADGRMLAGTESPGRVYRFDAADRPSVILDSGLTETRAIVTGRNGELFVAAIGRGDDTAPSSGETTSVAVAMPPTPTTATAIPPAPSSPPSGRRSTVFRVDASGSWDTYWDTPDVIYDLALDADGGLFAASGPDGRLYKIVGSQKAQLLTGVDAHQVTRLLTGTGGHLVAFATANPGRVIAVGSALQSPASYVSPVRDTKSASTWGAIRWESTGTVTLQTRTGNTEKPDETWTDWSAPYSHADGERVTSPVGRFVQWKAVLTSGSGAAPQLTSVTLAYLPRNARPVVSSITAHPPGVVFQLQFSDDGAIAGMDNATADARKAPSEAAPSVLGRRMFQKGLQTITWKADDADGDRMVYTVTYRRVGDATWHTLKADWTDSILVWDTTTVADGHYVVRVTASDAPANTPDRALTGEHDSDPITVDNTPPVMTMTVSRQGAAIHLLVHAVDATSPIDKVEYSIGGGAWQLVYPVTGLADSPDERYDILVATEADLARMVVRATDALQNVATQPTPVR
jgi:hypothetical protein